MRLPRCDQDPCPEVPEYDVDGERLCPAHTAERRRTACVVQRLDRMVQRGTPDPPSSPVFR